MTKLTILGCGASAGVPVIGCKCSVCLSSSPYNKRSRSAILIQSDRSNVLIDCGCDIREQLLKHKIDRLDGLIITHDHADHTSGLDDLRIFKLLHGQTINLYTDAGTLNALTTKYDYLFNTDILKPHAVDFYSKLNIGDIELQLFEQDHGTMKSLGIRVGDVVYSNDIINYPEESKQYLRNTKTIIMDCVDYKSFPTHSGLDLVMNWYNEFKPESMYLTNMSHMIDYFEIKARLPTNIIPAHDGLSLTTYFNL